jgi:GNAT superfamily N-acetyltransferase
MRDLHAASELIQREVLVSMYERCPPAACAELGLHLETIADVAVSVAERDASILLNRAHGLGSREAVTRQTIDAVVDCYRRHGVGRFFFHVYPSALPPQGVAWLEEAGLERTRGWMQFARSDDPAPHARTDLAVERVGPSRAMEFAAIVCDAFDLTVQARSYVAAILDDERWQCFMSFSGTRPAGAGAVFMHEGSAYLTFGATDPAFRRRGSQGALMSARIQAAIDAGCTYLFTETGEAVEGDRQSSYRNIVRYGFAPTVLCENWTIRRLDQRS